MKNLVLFVILVITLNTVIGAIANYQSFINEDRANAYIEQQAQYYDAEFTQKMTDTQIIEGTTRKDTTDLLPAFDTNPSIQTWAKYLKEGITIGLDKNPYTNIAETIIFNALKWFSILVNLSCAIWLAIFMWAKVVHT